MQKQEEIIVGLDIGTTKICAVVGEVLQNEISIIGIGAHPSKGLKKGVVVDIESTVNSIKKAIEEAELMAGCEIRDVYVGVAGSHISGFNSHGMITIKSSEVLKQDIDRVIETARSVAIPTDREIIHVLPQGYAVDNQKGIQNPVGMTGVRLEVDIHIVTGAVTSIRNIVKCANRAGLDVKDIVLESIASGESVLTKEEKALGTALIDLGGGTSDLAVFYDNNIKHTFVLPLGGNNLTNDIAIGLASPTAGAEIIKKKYGTCIARNINKDEIIEVPGLGGRQPRKLSRQILGEILEPRMEEILLLIKKELNRVNIGAPMPSGIVITGGTSLINDCVELGEAIFGSSVRLGSPIGISGLKDVVNNPIYATGVGLVLYGHKNQPRQNFEVTNTNFLKKILDRMKMWFKEVV